MLYLLVFVSQKCKMVFDYVNYFMQECFRNYKRRVKRRACK